MNLNAGLIAFKNSVDYQRDLTSLALYIGQTKAPMFTVSNGASLLSMRVRSGQTASKNIYSGLQNDGTGGAARDAASGWTATGNAAASASHTGAGSSMSYLVSYAAAAGTFGTPSFTATAANDVGNDARTVAVTVIGINAPLTPLVGVKGLAYTTLSPLSTVTCNGCTANGFGGTGLPTGLAVQSDGKITGTASVQGVFTLPSVTGFTTGSTLPSDGTVSRTVQITLVGINSGNPPIYDQGIAITTPYQVTTTGTIVAGPNAYSLSPLPAGMTFDTAAGRLAGTPTGTGSTVVTITAATTAGVTSEQVTISINAAVVPSNIASTLPLSTVSATGTRGTAILAGANFNISATSAPTVTYSSTELAAIGLNVDPATGVITGTPNTSGDIPVVLRASNIAGSGAPLSRTIRINPIVVPAITSATAVSTNVNQLFAGYQIVASNLPILSYAVVGPSTLPSGLSLNTTSGLISGTPDTSGTFTTDLVATNAAGNSTTHTMTFTIVPNSLPVVTVPLMAAPLVTGTLGSAITPIQIAATNPTIMAYGASGLPTGLTVNGSGQIIGTPTQSGDFAVVAQATNASGTGFASSVTIRISPNTVPTINGAGIVTLNVNAAPGTVYQITATNPIVTSYAVVPPSVLPPGLSLTTSTGAITGSPTASGAFSTTLGATNAAGTSAPFVLGFTINPVAVPVVSAPLQPSPLVTGTVGTVIAPIQISATNPAILSYGANGLPSGLSVNGLGQIVGTPTQSGEFLVSVNATNIVGIGNSAAPITIRINPNTAPVIGSAATAIGTVNTVFAGYQIIASNGPITGYSVVAPSQLPSGLVLATSTGAITGTPTASGVFSIMLNASNVSGSSAPFTLTLTVNPSSVPAITSPTFASLPAGVAIAPIQIVATNPVLLEYLATGLPPGLTVDVVAGTIAGTPTTPGNYSSVIGARNVVGTGNLVVPFTVGVPAPSACNLSVPLNTPTTLDLASCLFAGFAPTGVTIIATPAHGSALASGTRVTYTPVRNYFGADSFTFVGSGAGGISPQGTVTVTVTGRPDPAQDPVVGALLTAQNETAQRFSRAQISNFQRRMESLHRGPGEPGAVASGLQGRIDTPVAAGFGSVALAGAGVAGATTAAPALAAASDWLAGRNNAVTAQTPGAVTTLAANHAPVAARESDVVRALAAGLGVQSLPLAESVISLVKDRSVNLSGVATGLGLNGKPTTGADGSTSYWIEGVATFGTRDASGGLGGSEFSSDGVTVGVDKRYSDQMALGMGLGYARDKTMIGTDGSINRAKGYSLAVYGSYQPTPTTFVDGLLGIGSLDFDTTRYVAPISDFAYGQRTGSQVFGSLSGGYEFRNGNLLVSPYGRIDFSTDRLNDSTETGAGAYALRYVRQTSTSIQGAVGMRAESIHAADFGYVVPRARVEYRHEFRSSGDSYIQYADQLGGPLYRLASPGGPRDSALLGLGSDFILRDGLTLSVEYQLSHSFAKASTHALRLRLSKDFDVRGLPRLVSYDAESAHDEPVNVQVEAGAVYDDNVTRAKAGPNRVGDHLYSVNVGKTVRQPMSANSQLLWIGNIGGEKFRRYNGLSRASISGEVEYQYRASSEFGEPTFGAFARLTGEAFESELRDGYRMSAGVSVRQSLTDRINVFAALSHNVRNASSQVFSSRDNAIRGNIDYALSDKDILYMGAEYRRGDIVSTGRASLEAVTVADIFAQDDAYPGGQMFSYRFKGSTSLLTVGYNMGLGPRDSIDFSWRHIRSTPGLRPSFVTSPRSYTANQLSLVYLMRF